MIDDPRRVLARNILRSVDARPGWEHPSMEALLSGITSEQARARPLPERRSIWELVEHTTAWAERVTRRLRHQPVPERWEPWPDLSGRWDELVARAISARRDLADALELVPVDEPYPHPDEAMVPHWTAALGAHIHDAYHLGQIALLRAQLGLPAVE